MRFSLKCRICGQEMKSASKNHIREDYKKLIEQLDKPETSPMQFFEVLLQEDWLEE